MTETISPLTRDESICLQIMRNGDTLAPIGRWKSALLSLEKRGYAREIDPVNFGITPAGHAACDAAEKQAMLDMIKANNDEYWRRNPKEKPSE